MTERKTRIPQPSVHLTELIIALAAVPEDYLAPFYAALGRIAADHGWDPEIRGFCTILLALDEDREAGVSLRSHLDALDQVEVSNGSLAWVVSLDRGSDE